MSAVIAITPNPAMDITIESAQLIPGHTHRVPTAARRLGGKGINVARVAAQQGFLAYALGPVAADLAADPAADPGTASADSAAQAPAGSAADPAAQASAHELLRWRLTATDVPTRATFALHIGDTDDTYMFNEPGSPYPRKVWEGVEGGIGKLLKQHPGAVVTVSGSWPPGSDPELMAGLVRTVHAGGGFIIVDAAGDMLRVAAKAGADLLKPNAAELAATTGTDDPVRGAAQLADAGARTVVASLGEEGLLFIEPARKGHVRAYLPQPLAGNPTGAGDALVSALATSLIHTPPAQAGSHASLFATDAARDDALRTAVAWSAAALACPVAGEIGSNWKELVPTVVITSS